MGAARTLTQLCVYGERIMSSNNSQRLRPLLSCAPATVLGFTRGVHSQDITKNMQFISNEKFKLIADPNTFKLDTPRKRPMCIIINWLLARQKHVMKYAALYLEQGFDVLSVSCSPWQLMWPMKGTQLVAGDLLRFMKSNDSSNPLVVHGFSVGGYIWGELLVHAVQDKNTYQPVLDRVAAQIWDSPADISEITIGVPAAVFPKNKIMQKTLKTYLEYHMRTFYEPATVHYIRASQLYHAPPCRAPCLFLFSRSDPVGAETNIRSAHHSFTAMGIKSTMKCWDKSPHVQHFMYHKKEYLSALYSHLDSCGLISQPDKMRMIL